MGTSATAAVVSTLPTTDVTTIPAGSSGGGSEGTATVGEGGDAVLAPPTTESAEGHGLGPDAQDQGLGLASDTASTTVPTTTDDTHPAPADDGITATGLAPGSLPGQAPGLGVEEGLLDDDVSYSSIIGKHLSGHEDRTVYVTGIHACCTKAGKLHDHILSANFYPSTVITHSTNTNID